MELLTEELPNSSTPKKLHPLFPFPSETALNPELGHSDHLPILAKVSLPNSSSFNVISLNILGGLYCSGIHYPNQTEPDEELKNRYQRMVNGLMLGIKKHNIDAIALQEATPELIVPILKNTLGDNWEIIEDYYGVVTCFDKSKWTLESTKTNKGSRIRSLTLKNTNKLTVDFHNIWGNFDPFPLNLENQCCNALANNKAQISIIIGDTNSRIAPLDNTPRNITTGAIPLMFNRQNKVPENVQTPDYPDGGFYRDAEGLIHQLDIETLNFENGDIVKDERTKEEMHPWPEYRMVMCLDSSYHTQRFFEYNNLVTYEEKLQTQFENDRLVVRMAADCYNHKAVGIGFPSALNSTYSRAHEALKNEVGFQFKELSSGHQTFNCIFVPIDKFNKLQSTLNNILLLNVIIKAAIDANEKYQNSNTRDFLFGKLSNLRHKDKGKDIANRFKDSINNDPWNKEQAIDMIEAFSKQWFLGKHTHSFSTYLFDELSTLMDPNHVKRARYNEADWENLIVRLRVFQPSQPLQIELDGDLRDFHVM